MKETGDKHSKAGKRDRKTDNFGRANFVSKMLFCWMVPTFKRGTRRDLDLEDISLPAKSDASGVLADRLERNWFLEEAAAARAGRPASMRRALLRTFLWEHVPDALVNVLFNVGLRVMQPAVMALMLQYWEQESGVSRSSALGYAGLLFAISLVGMILIHHNIRRLNQFGMRLRVACSSLIYRKVLRMDAAALNLAAAGKVVNLMSNDMSRFEMAFGPVPVFWVIPLHLVVVGGLTYQGAGVSGLIGIAIIILQTVPIQIYMGRITARFRLKVAQATDERVRLMSEIISGIQVIKMYAWERPFEDMVSRSREKEVRLITKTSYLRGIYLSFLVFTDKLTLYCTLLAYTLLGRNVTAAVVFSLAQYFSILQQTFAISLPNAISGGAELLVSIDRLSDFLNLSERSDLAEKVRGQCLRPSTLPPHKLERDQSQPAQRDQTLARMDGLNGKLSNGGIFNLGFEPSEAVNVDSSSAQRNSDVIELTNASAQWGSESPQETLKDITLKVARGQLCAVIGSVGAGKSSLLQLLLAELKPTSGEVRVDGSVSYASQEPWLFVATVRQNILFGLPYDGARYKEVVRVCALEKDFQQMPRGDQTLVGERGVSLSGGQRARINLARAVYRQADVYLLDDPLSAVDAAVGRQLFEDCIDGYLRARTRLLVTHHLHYLKAADLIIVLSNGAIQNIGTYKELVSSEKNLAKLLSPRLEDKDDDCSAVLLRKRSYLKQDLKIDPIASNEDPEEGEELEEEQRERGLQSLSLCRRYWAAGSSAPRLALLLLVMLLGQLASSACDYWVTYWTNQETKYLAKLNDIDDTTAFSDGSNDTADAFADHEIQIDEKVGLFTPAEYLYIYSGFIASCVFLTIIRSAMFFRMAMSSSKGLHDQMFHSLLRGVMRFFDMNPSGRVLNRFSKDIGAVDELLPKAAFEMLQIFLVAISIVILITVSMVWLIFPVVVLGVIIYHILIVYLKSAQAIKRIEGVTKSPVFSQLTATLNGISTIRCVRAQDRFIKDFDDIQDIHTSTWNQYLTSSSTIGFWLDGIFSLFLGIVAFSFILVDESKVEPGNCGLAISLSITLNGMLQHGIKQMAEVISQMTSVERILQYTKVETENDLEKSETKTPENWPSSGSVQIRNASLRYASDTPPVLINLSIDIQPGWKVGIVGRTGAGKTSLISALFRLAKVEGSVEIDGLDTGLIALQDLRSRISIIPQEPVLFTASVRYNLDPFNKYDDASLWQALEDVELRAAVPSLEYMVAQGGANFSLGQRQLICLARAILKKNKILVLDEATANVDPQTDAFIQHTIREKFSSCTVLTIAHRLNTVVDSDRVLVMNFGRAVEFDQPYLLLSNPRGHFYGMVRETGPKMAQQLHDVAMDTFVRNGGLIEEDSAPTES